VAATAGESGYFASRAEAAALLEAHPAEHARSTELAAQQRLELAQLRQHFEVLADALAAAGNAQLEQEGEGWPRSRRSLGRAATRTHEPLLATVT
jgi:hypothetical protein